MLNPLRQVLNEAADRFDFRTPFDSVKQLKTKRTDVDPFTLAEVKQILDTVRPDFRHYFTVRFFTGLRTGEVDGLQWKYVDFDNRLILVRETIVGGEEEYTKTDGSQRDIQMSQLVFDALQAQLEATGKLGKFVFCNRLGTPLDHKNVTNRVWYPLLRHLNLKQRRPYQCRHTATPPHRHTATPPHRRDAVARQRRGARVDRRRHRPRAHRSPRISLPWPDPRADERPWGAGLARSVRALHARRGPALRGGPALGADRVDGAALAAGGRIRAVSSASARVSLRGRGCFLKGESGKDSAARTCMKKASQRGLSAVWGR
jgi:integrase